MQNPVLTHRHLGKGMDITTTGHADLVETQNGDWWAVMLGVRPIDGNWNLGRETFLTPVEWQETHPVFNPGVGRVLMEDKRPDLPWTPVPDIPVRDNFDSSGLGFQWCFLRTPFEKWYSLSNRKGWLEINLRPHKVTELTNPSLIAHRQEHHVFEAYTEMEFEPENENEKAGIIIMQNDRFHYKLLLSKSDNKQYLSLIKAGKIERKFRKELNETVVARIEYPEKSIVLGLKGNYLNYEFLYGTNKNDLKAIAEKQDGRILCSNISGGFIGAFLGMYVTSNGTESSNKAYYNWFEYNGIKK